ncbi:ATP-binding cassette, subfamily C [Sulfitobacter marinus]|uniref:ATP-binding cassette, subfamily C n=1 Tax=Sulfitobacter marinus TaxID=394264 RepID=A0A1I6VBN5_9RHOB|nr:type I secretion system permease/ATPase [Sulfitobacter marinus]SFT11143.1 ATP-binding cassette, subfamily C [Sulfitobacter marinus]
MAAVDASNKYAAALRRQKPGVGFVLILSGIISILMLTGSIYMLQVYDRVLSSGSVVTLTGLFVIVVILYLFFGVFDLLRQRILSRIGTRLECDLGRSGFLGQFQAKQGANNNATDPLRHLSGISQFLSGPTAGNLFDLPFVPVFLTVLFIVHPLLGFIVVGGAVVAGVSAWVASVIAGRWQAQRNQGAARQAEFTTEAVRNSEAVIAMGMENNLAAHWQKMQLASLKTHQKAAQGSEILASFSKTFRFLLQSSILTVGAVLVLREEISPGMIIASSVLSGRVLAPIDQAIGQWRAIAQTLYSHRALLEFFENTTVRNGTIELPKPSGRLTVKSLTKFAAGASASRQELLLQSVSFSLEPGDGLGVIGKSAAGKSILARLLVGAWQPDRGEVCLDGAGFDKWPAGAVGRHIGYLPQTVTLLPGTIAQNIARFDSDTTDADIVVAAQLANVHDLILRLPNGYATEVGGASGSPLSGGQIQRIALARAVIFKPALIVLDEPNAHLDGAGDTALEDTIKQLRAAGSTVVVMAHRPSAIAAVNKILVLDQGRMSKFGEKEKILGSAPRPQTPRLRQQLSNHVKQG